MEKEQRKFQVKIEDDIAEGIYSNIPLIGFSGSEIFIDFGRILPGSNKIKVLSRIIMNPQAGKQLMMQLSKSVKDYEEKFGEIKVNEIKDIKKDIGF